MHLPRYLFLLLALFATAATAPAQLRILGDWEITNLDGSPLLENATVGKTIYVDPTGQIISDLWVDSRNGQGRVLVPRERSVLTVLDVHGLNYSWENASGTFGLIYWSHDRGRFETHVLTGPNAGRITAMRRL